MSKPVWYRSLYWRIAFGFITLLAVVLGAQFIIFLWLTDRIVGPSSRSPQQLAASVAADVAVDLAAQPGLVLEPYLQKKFGHIYQPFLVVLNDGRIGSNRSQGLPPGFVRGLLPRGRRGGGRFGGGGDPWRPGEGRGGTPEGRPPSEQAPQSGAGAPAPPRAPELRTAARPARVGRGWRRRPAVCLTRNGARCRRRDSIRRRGAPRGEPDAG